eukprot:TRINITY_DN1442_c0_g2_i2.p1 TRINITY_DN1442_c0_g2~~TRINITY_DN1442_c0_g2_i2.p1  ORF type:complete len:3758 (+),score=972.48 TRINITY_DN1442_c0_g2_i2:1382-11275(+)
MEADEAKAEAELWRERAREGAMKSQSHEQKLRRELSQAQATITQLRAENERLQSTVVKLETELSLSRVEARQNASERSAQGSKNGSPGSTNISALVDLQRSLAELILADMQALHKEFRAALGQARAVSSGDDASVGDAQLGISCAASGASGISALLEIPELGDKASMGIPRTVSVDCASTRQGARRSPRSSPIYRPRSPADRTGRGTAGARRRSLSGGKAASAGVHFGHVQSFPHPSSSLTITELADPGEEEQMPPELVQMQQWVERVRKTHNESYMVNMLQEAHRQVNTNLAVQSVSTASSDSKRGGLRNPATVQRRPAEGTASTGASSGRGQDLASAVALAADTAAHSKFDAADQVAGQTATHDRSPEKLQLFPGHYVPENDPIHTVDHLKEWSDPKGRLWPEWAIDRLVANCSMMVEKHSHGEPRAVVVPLFAYSSFMFRKEAWAIWLPCKSLAGPSGLWVTVTTHPALEADFTQQFERREEGEVTSPTRAASGAWPPGGLTHKFNSEMEDLDYANEHGPPCPANILDLSADSLAFIRGHVHPRHLAFNSITQSGRQDAADETRPAGPEPHDWLASGRMQLGWLRWPKGRKVQSVWEGLAVYTAEERSPDWQSQFALDSTVGSPMSQSRSYIDAAADLQAPQVDDSMESNMRLLLMRYSIPGHCLGQPDHPLYDNIVWLPPPVAMCMSLEEMKQRKLRFQLERGTDFVTLTRIDAKPNQAAEPASLSGGWRRKSFATSAANSAHQWMANLGSRNKPMKFHSGASSWNGSDDGGDSTGDTPWRPGPDSDKLDDLPPPGLLEYIFSRRSDEELWRIRQLPSSETQDKSPGAAPDGSVPSIGHTPPGVPLAADRPADECDHNSLGRSGVRPPPHWQNYHYNVAQVTLHETLQQFVARCQSERNQQQYSAKLHEELKKFLQDAAQQEELQEAQRRSKNPLDASRPLPPLLDSSSRDIADENDVNTTLIKHVMLLKGGEDPTAPDSSPSPLDIVHSLDLQVLRYNSTKWTIAFSGKPYVMAQGGVCLPMYRCLSQWNDQPYWHLNCAIRNLQFQRGSGTLVIKPVAQVAAKKDKVVHWVMKGNSAVRRKQWDKEISGEFCCPDPATLAHGLDLIGSAASLDHKRTVREDIDALKQKCWRITMRQRRGGTVYMPGCGFRVSWENPSEDKWRDTGDADKWRALSAPFSASQQDQRAAFVVRGISKSTGEKIEVSLKDTDYTLDLGTWMVAHCQPIIWHVQSALRSMRAVVGRWSCAPEGKLKLYRGLGGVSLDPRVYARGKVLLWGQFSSSSKDQGVAQSFAMKGDHASVFTLEGFSCRLIAPWSRFGREEEWLFPLNTLWQLTQLLSEEQQQILGRSGLQLYEMHEVDEYTMHLIQVRSVLSKATTAPAASVVFHAEAALTSGGNILNLALRSGSEGTTKETWSFCSDVVFDGYGRCPLRTSSNWRECDQVVAEKLAEKLYRPSNILDQPQQLVTTAPQRHHMDDAISSASGWTGGGPGQGWGQMGSGLPPGFGPMPTAAPGAVTPKAEPAQADDKSEDGFMTFREGPRGKKEPEGDREVRQLAAKALAIPTPYQLSLKKAMPSLMEFRVTGMHAPTGQVDWEVDVTMRRLPGRESQAVRDEGATLLALLLRRCVPLQYIDLRNNGITQQGAKVLLRAVRDNRSVRHLCVDRVGAPLGAEYSKCKRLYRIQRKIRRGGRHEAVPIDSLDLTTAVQAINMRCMQHRGRLAAERLEEFGAGWPMIAAVALYDLPSIDLDFDGTLSRDTQHGTRNTEQFVMLLAEQCIRENGGRLPDSLPRLPGALPAASIYAHPTFIMLLRDMGSSKLEVDAFGETPCIKASRRAGIQWVTSDPDPVLAKHEPVTYEGAEVDDGAAVVQVRLYSRDDDQDSDGITDCELPLPQVIKALETAQDHVMLPRPPSAWRGDEVLWRTKNFALEVVRLWHDKQRICTGLLDSHNARRPSRWPTAGVLDEFLQNFYSNYRHVHKLMLESVQLMSYGQHDRVGGREAAEAAGAAGQPTCGMATAPAHPASLIPTAHSLSRAGGLPRQGTLRNHATVALGAQLAAYDSPPCSPAGSGGEGRRGGVATARSTSALSCPLRSLRDLAGKLLERSRTTDIARNPVSRIGVTLLVYHFYNNEFEQAKSAEQREEGSEKVKVLLRKQLTAAAQTLYQPGVYGSKATVPEAREELRQWVGVWALLGCVLTVCGRKIDTELYTEICDQPQSVFLTYLGLAKGDTFTLPGPSLWCHADRRPKQQGGKQHPFSKIRLYARGPASFEDISEVLEHRDYPLCLPALCVFTVREVRFESDRTLTVQLIHRGSMLESDPELIRWRRDVLDQAEKAERILRLGGGDDDHITGGMTVMDRLHRWDRKRQQEEDKKKEDLRSIFTQQLQRRRMRFNSRGMIENEGASSPSNATGGPTFYCSEALMMQSATFIEHDAQQIIGVLNHCHEFANFSVAPMPTLKPHLRWSNGNDGLHDDFAFPCVKRPACTLLYQIGRSPSTRAPWQAHIMRHVDLSQPILDRLDFSTEVVVSAEEIERYVDHWAQSQEGEDTDRYYFEMVKHSTGTQQGSAPAADAAPLDVAAACSRYGHSARVMLGDQAFRCTISELQQCVASTLVVTAAHLPRLFLLDLVRQFAMPSETAWFLRAARTVPLAKLASPEEWQNAASLIISNHKSLVRRREVWYKESKAALEEAQNAHSLTQLSASVVATAMLGVQPKDHKDVIAGLRKRVYINECLIRGVRDELQRLQDMQGNETREVQVIRAAIGQWMKSVLRNPGWWGFRSAHEARLVFDKSPMEISTEMCISQKGYFLTGGSKRADGRDWGHNQLCPKSVTPAVFLSAPGLDFGNPLPCAAEGPKYFEREDRGPAAQHYMPHEGWTRFRTNGEEGLLKRVKTLYRVIFLSAQQQGVRNMSMLPLGLGVFLMQLDRPQYSHLKDKVVDCYFKAQFELLSETDWGFETYYINAQRFRQRAEAILSQEVGPMKDYNCPTEDLFLRCNIVFHNRDAKFLCHVLATRGVSSAFLNPSDSQAMIHGVLGMYWETGRADNYVGEEDWAATTTGVLGNFNIARTAIGLDDVVFQLREPPGARLHVSKVFGRQGVVCSVCSSDSHSTQCTQCIAKHGPFGATDPIQLDCRARRLRFQKSAYLVDGTTSDVSSGRAEPQTATVAYSEFQLAGCSERLLQHLFQRLQTLQRCRENQLPPFPCPTQEYYDPEDEAVPDGRRDSSATVIPFLTTQEPSGRHHSRQSGLPITPRVRAVSGSFIGFGYPGAAASAGAGGGALDRTHTPRAAHGAGRLAS